MPGGHKVRQDGTPPVAGHGGLSAEQVTAIVEKYQQVKDQYTNPLALWAYIKAGGPPGHRNVAQVLRQAGVLSADEINHLGTQNNQGIVTWVNGAPVAWNGSGYSPIPGADTAGE